MAVEVVIVPQACRGCPYCEEELPEVFRVVDGRVALRSGGYRARIPLAYLDRLQRARSRCPAGGIHYRVLKPYEP